ncbi:MAG: tetratricopeptide repeat protein [Verrucomicrobiota bacterium]
MLPPILMLTTKKPAQIFLIFSLGWIAIGGWAGCAPAGSRALQKGERLIQEGKYSEAVKKFEEATKALPTNAKAWNHLGLGYQYAGDAKEAARAYEQALILDRNLAAARYNLGALHLEQRNFSAAITELTTFTQLDPKNPDGWIKLGNAQTQFAALVSTTEKNRQFDAAKKSFDIAQKLRPSAEALNAMGLLQIQRGRPRDSISSFTAALQQQPDYAPALLNLAVVYQQHLDERRLALMNYQQFLKVAKDSPDAAQVRVVVRQLEGELNRPIMVANSTSIISGKVPASTNNSSGTSNQTSPKAETNAPKNAVVPKPVPIILTPKAQPPPKKEPPVEVARLPDEAPFKPAQDLPTNISQPVAVVSNSAISPANPVSRPSSPEKGSGMLTKLNPVSWFKRKPKSTTPMTELPVAKSVAETSPPVLVETKSVPRISPKASEERTALSIPRYKYRSPKKPSEGKRAEAEPLFQRGMQAQKDRRLADALAAYGQAIKSDPAFFEANYNLALAAREVGDLSAALNAYERSLAIMPESVNARYNFAFTLQEAGYFQDAANELRKLLEQNPNETRGHLLLGNLCAQRLNRDSSAREHYLKVLETEPNHPQATQIRYWLAAHP